MTTSNVGLETSIIYQGDCKHILSAFPSDSIDLIYLDPPFFSNKHYEVIWGNGAELKAFEDRWKGGIMNYIDWMKEKVEQMHRILKPTGSIYLHCDTHASHYLKVYVLDQLFGYNKMINEIIWSYKGGGAGKDSFGRRHDVIFYYSKGKTHLFNADNVRIPYLSADGRDTKYAWGHHKGTDKEYKPNPKGKIPEDVWEIAPINSMSKERLGYPTQKPEALLERIVNASSNEGDIVLDPMVGGGTTLAAAHNLKRRWIGIDVSPLACKMSYNRLRKLGASVRIVKGAITENELRKFDPFQFQQWACDKLGGRISERKSSDMGIDGYTFIEMLPIQVKQSDDVGRNVVDNFETAMRRIKKERGFIVAFSFGKGAYEEVKRAKFEDNINIELLTVKELLERKEE
jgi:DNA modification methylase